MNKIEELKAALAASTPGKWAVGDLDKNGQRIVRSEHIELFTGWHHCVGSIEKEMEANAKFITLLHNHAPALIECVEALENLVICPAFNGQVFERDKESHREWTLARAALAKLENKDDQD